MEQPPSGSEIDVLSLIEERLPRYVMSCLGYDDLEVIASLKVRRVAA